MALVRVPTLEAQIAAGADSAEVEIVWPREGMVLALAIGAVSGVLVDRAGLGLAIVRREGKEFVADDFGRQFLQGCQIGGAHSERVDWWMVLLPVAQFERWIVQLTNAGPNPVTPQVLFDVAWLREQVSP